MSAIDRLRATLDAALSGQREAKTGLLLALVAREHAYVEGPPGCGKTRLAEALAQASGARVAAVRFHRDLRESDLLGDAVLRTQRDGASERLALDFDPGPLLACELAVLDDVSRAPGEALGPLLRILSEREARGRRLPLETAIATAAPAESESYADPLEPSQLDRFAIQVRVRGLLLGGRFSDARRLLRLGLAPGGVQPLDTEERHALQRRAAALPIEPEARHTLLRLARRLCELASDDGESLVSDRAFGVAAPRIMRAHALLRRSARVEPVDVEAVRYMLACRVPEAVRELFPALVEEVLEPERPQPRSQPGVQGVRSQVGGPASGRPVRVRGVEAPEARIDLRSVSGAESAALAADVEPLVRALEGRLDRGRVEPKGDPGGQPRRYRALDRLDEIFDADPVDATLFLGARLPGAPRTYRRERRNAGGTLALIRDVSASMEGRLSRWSGEVVAGVVRTGARHRMRIGYVEFNHTAERFSVRGRYKLLALASRRRAEGRTNYEAPLRTALAEFRARSGRSRHIVLLTDGVPVVGDPLVREERQLARSLGVRVHTVFLGLGECPGVLDELSLETGGLRFLARPGADGRLAIREREPLARPPASTGGEPTERRTA
jgi:MoxR-like ATPase